MIKVYVPASIGNVGVGFDLLGMAMISVDGDVFGDYVTIEYADQFNLKNIGRFSHQLPSIMEENIVFQCWDKFCKILGKLLPLSICFQKNIPVGAGLGSSASSIVATLVAMNHYCGCPLTDDQLLVLMGEMEGKISGSVHFDNVASCFFGGMQLVLQECGIISQSIPIFRNWLWIVAYPGITISTEMSRLVLPKKYSRKDCVTHSRYISGFVHACHTQQELLAIRCMKDVIAEPYRSQLLPIEISYIRESLIKRGAVACGISGSGSTIFVLCNTENVINRICEWLSQFYLKNDLGFIRVCHLDECGARIISE